MGRLSKGSFAPRAHTRAARTDAEDLPPPPYQAAAPGSGAALPVDAAATSPPSAAAGPSTSASAATTIPATGIHRLSDVKIAPPPPLPTPATSFACILLRNSDRITTIRLPNELVPHLSDAIVSAWPAGMQRGEANSDGWDWKLRGVPWRDGVQSRRIIMAMLAGLAEVGWHVLATNNLSKEAVSKDSIFLRPGPARKRTFFAVSFLEEDKIRIVDPPSDEVRELFVRVLNGWPKGLQETKAKDATCLQLKLRGSPWNSFDRTSQIAARALMLDLLGMFDAQGYELACCVEMPSGVTDSGEEPESWFFGSKEGE